MNSYLYAVLLLVLLGSSDSIDLELKSVTCDQTLPIFAMDNGVQLTCKGNSRCTFGDDALISGTRKSNKLSPIENASSIPCTQFPKDRVYLF